MQSYGGSSEGTATARYTQPIGTRGSAAAAAATGAWRMRLAPAQRRGGAGWWRGRGGAAVRRITHGGRAATPRSAMSGEERARDDAFVRFLYDNDDVELAVFVV